MRPTISPMSRTAVLIDVCTGTLFRWVADLGALDRALKAAAETLDHGLLNDHSGLELPTLEHLCLWFVNRLQPEWPGLCRVTVARPTIHEKCTLTL
jgi:6-pyruvoyltetrahydropterin/6-carboxytetrahydropterin synthase